MDAASPPDPAGEPARILHVLRHALADPLSAAALKLDLVERRLLSPSGADPSWTAEKARAVQADIGATTRLLDLLLRLAEIAGERPERTSIHDVCLRSGVPLDAAVAGSPRLPLRVIALADAVRKVAAFAAGSGGAGAATGHEGFENGRATLTLEGTHATADGQPGTPSRSASRDQGRGSPVRGPRRRRRRRRPPRAHRARWTSHGALLVASPHRKRRPAEGRRVKVLVVEDEPRVRDSLVELVEELGYVAFAAGSVADARDALARSSPDVCITDLGLPDGSGLDVVRAAKAARADCAVLVLTGKGSILAAVEAMKAGAHDFLLKPLKPALPRLVSRAPRGALDPAPRGASRARDSRPARRDGRPVAGDAGGLPPDRPRRGLRGARHDHRRERHGQGSRGAHRARPLAPRQGAVRRGQLRCDLADTSSRASSSGTRRGRSREPSGAAPARSRWRTGEPCSWTR